MTQEYRTVTQELHRDHRTIRLRPTTDNHCWTTTIGEREVREEREERSESW